MPTRRSPYSDRLAAFPGLAFSDGAELAHPGAWRSLFPTLPPNAPLVLEVGCHDATLLSAVAPEHPHTAFLGLDWVPRHLVHAAERLTAASPPLQNVALLHARAQDLTRLFAPAELSELWLFHPEPAAALFSPAFLRDAATLLAPAGRLTLKTDHPGYFQNALSLLSLPEPPTLRTDKHKPKELLQTPTTPPDPHLRTLFTPTALSPNFHRDSIPPNPPLAPRPFTPHLTPYEKRFHSKRLPIYYLELTRLPVPNKSQLATPQIANHEPPNTPHCR